MAVSDDRADHNRAFLLVFLILRAQNKDTHAVQLKLNEIIASLNGANNRLIDIENKSEQEIGQIHRKYETVAEHLQRDAVTLATETISVIELAEEITHERGRSCRVRLDCSIKP